MAGYPQIPVGEPVAQQAVPARPLKRQVTEGFFNQLGLPGGIQETLQSSMDTFARRIWIVDNSGSMSLTDGHRIIRGPGGREGMVTSSRWEELGDTIRWHASFAAHTGAPYEFRMLNPPGGGSPQVIQCGLVDVPPKVQTDAIEKFLEPGPTGRTPLCQQIYQVVEQLKLEAPMLQAAGQKVVLVIASDGAATDGNVADALRPLHNLPVMVIVRLCTDDDSVVKYWEEVDTDLEVNMDVLDDLCGEAANVAEYNGWLTYGAALHRMRESGVVCKVVDLIDERKLAPSEAIKMIEVVLGGKAKDLPNPELSWKEFEAGLTTLLKKEPDVWDPLRNRRRPWFDVKKLRALNKKDSCSVM